MFTEEQIEAAALDLFEEREANLRRRWGVGYIPGRFIGAERENCIECAKGRLEQEERARQEASALIDSMGHLSNADLRRVIGGIEGRRNQPMYFIATHSAYVQSDYADLSKYRTELARRETGLHAMMEAAE